jgi:hypothetical protein
MISKLFKRSHLFYFKNTAKEKQEKKEREETKRREGKNR